jgi:uncharacterized protein YceK
MEKNFTVLKVLALAVATTGCMTVQTKYRGHWGHPYSGSTCDVRYAGELAAEPVGWLFLPFPVGDLPLSFVADSMFLPVDLFATDTARVSMCPPLA